MFIILSSSLVPALPFALPEQASGQRLASPPPFTTLLIALLRRRGQPTGPARGLGEGPYPA